jgi:glutathione S-transferase
MKLYNADLSPNCLRVRAVINELGLPVELVDVNLLSRERPPELLEVNPNGKVPAFVDDDGFSLFESRAINVYLASKRPERGLYPDDPKRRAIVEQWSYWQALQLGPVVQAIGYERLIKPQFGLGQTDEALVAQKIAELDKQLAVLEIGLDGKEWLAGSLSLADFATAAPFALRVPAGVSLSKAPKTEAWLERIESLPSWQKARPKV